VPGTSLRVREVRLATNRVEVEVLSSAAPADVLWLAWEEQNGQLTAVVEPAGWLELLSLTQRQALAAAISGLLQRSGADEARATVPLIVEPTFSWADWIARWTTPLQAVPHSSHRLPDTKVLRRGLPTATPP